MEKEINLKKIYITINKRQAKAISKLGDYEFQGIIKPLHVKILKHKIYKDNKRARILLGYKSDLDIYKFFYYLGFIESMILSHDK